MGNKHSHNYCKELGININKPVDQHTFNELWRLYDRAGDGELSEKEATQFLYDFGQVMEVDISEPTWLDVYTVLNEGIVGPPHPGGLVRDEFKELFRLARNKLKEYNKTLPLTPELKRSLNDRKFYLRYHYTHGTDLESSDESVDSSFEQQNNKQQETTAGVASPIRKGEIKEDEEHEREETEEKEAGDDEEEEADEEHSEEQKKENESGKTQPQDEEQEKQQRQRNKPQKRASAPAFNTAKSKTKTTNGKRKGKSSSGSNGLFKSFSFKKKHGKHTNPKEASVAEKSKRHV
ncbi:FBA domain-containing protein [Balamuthia mandrillaris]